MSFQIQPLDPAPFFALFDLSDEELARRGAKRVTADAPNRYPCRVELADAAPGEELILCNYAHQAEETPYAASHAIFVKQGAAAFTPEIDEVPEVLERRTLSLRGFDRDHMMATGEVVEGPDLSERLAALFEDEAIDYAHIHFAGRGCFAARVSRA